MVAVEVAIAGEGLKPPSPVRLSWRRSDDGGLEISWTRRSRYGWAWVDEVDAPLGEARELYLMTVAGAAQSIQFEANGPTATVPAATLATLGESLELKVQQIGDFAASRPLTAVISVN